MTKRTTPDRIVREAAVRIGASLGVEETLRAIADSAQRALGADRATCYVWDAEAGVVSAVYTTEAAPGPRAYLEAARGKRRDELPIQFPPDETMLILDGSAPSRAVPGEVGAALGTTTLIGIELEHSSVLLGHGEPYLGTLFCSYREFRELSEDDRSILRGLANLAALALANARLHAHTLESLAAATHEAETDALTGLWNRRALERRLEALSATCGPGGDVMSVIVLDLDNFKRLNDTHGHAVGDDCLRLVAHTIEASLRRDDVAGRLGGEEFLVVLPGATSKHGWMVAERLRQRIAALPSPPGLTLGASLGVAGMPAHSDTVAELIRAADSAMYEAKARGRNTTVVYTPWHERVRGEIARHERASLVGYTDSVIALAAALDARHPSTYAHSTRVADFCVGIARHLGMEDARIEQIRIAGLLHDVGKVGIPDAVLYKSSALTEAEWAQVRRHPEIGAKLLVHPDLAGVREWVLRHHERPDGGGYPDGLRADEIPIEALILAVADAFEAMTADRPYRWSLGANDANEQLCSGRGTQFDPRILDAFDEWRATILADSGRPGLAEVPHTRDGAVIRHGRFSRE